MTVRVVAGLVLAATLALAGCSESEGGAAVNGDSGQPPAGPGEPTADGPAEPSQPAEDVPTVSDPIEDIAEFREDPCRMLTDEQASRIGYTDAEKLDTPSGDGCDWRGNDGAFGVTLFAETSTGLDGHYRERGDFGVFVPMEVDGYPAIHLNRYEDEDIEGGCAIVVGITDEQILDIDVQMHRGSPNRERPCEVAEEAASATLETLKAAQ